MMEEVVEVLQSSYAMKKLHYQRNLLECRDLFAQFSNQLQDACLTFEIEIKGGKLPQPNILWFSYGFENDIASEQPILEQNAGRLYSSELTNAKGNNSKDRGREAAFDEVVKDFPHLSFQSSTLYLVCTIFTVVNWLFNGKRVQKGAVVSLCGLMYVDQPRLQESPICASAANGRTQHSAPERHSDSGQDSQLSN